MNKSENTVILAGLLCWIYDYPGLHNKEFDDGLKNISHLVDTTILESLLRSNLDSIDETYATVYQKARELVGATQGQRGKAQGKIFPLRPVFDAVELHQPFEKVGGYNPERLGMMHVFPKHGEKVADVKFQDILAKFKNELVTLWGKKPQTFTILLSHMLALYEEYLWCLPGMVGIQTDLSLYDCARITTTIITVLLKSKSGKIGVVVGDISGIQRFIFGISNIGAGGVAKRLRARSFLLSILSKVIAHKILDEFELPYVNMIMSAAGKFYIVTPDLEMEEQLTQIQKDLDRWFIDQYYGEIGVNLAWGHFDPSDLQRFDMILNTLNRMLHQKKERPFYQVLCNENGWQDEFVRPIAPGETVCPACRRHLILEQDEVCPSCQREADLGAKLANAKFLAFYRSNEDKYQLIPGYGLNLYKYADDIKGTPYLVLKMNETGVSELSSVPAGFCFIANYVPLEPAIEGSGDNRVPISFDQLAGKASGKKLLGYLKADVDQLGSVFLYGFHRDHGEQWNSVTRIIGLSRMMELFFAGWLHRLMQDRYTYCYTVFSGGDDLFIVGPWDEVFNLAQEIREKFTEYVGFNPNLTLSAGVALGKPKEPIAHCAERVEELLERSKERILPGQATNRNQLTFLNETVKWDDLSTIYNDATHVAGWFLEDLISASFLWKLRYIASLYKQFYFDKEPKGMRYSPLLDYELSRNFSKKHIPSEQPARKKFEECSTWFTELRNHLTPRLKHLNFYINYAFLMKGGHGDD